MSRVLVVLDQDREPLEQPVVLVDDVGRRVCFTQEPEPLP